MKLTISKKISALLLSMLIIAAANILIIYYYQNLQKHDSLIVNISGRQRMLSQKIAKLALSVSNGNDDDRQLLSDAISLYDSSLKIIDQGGGIKGDAIPPAPDFMEEIFKKNWSIWDLFKKNALIVVKEKRDNPLFSEATVFIEANDELLLKRSNDLVNAYELLPNTRDFAHEINVAGRQRMLSQKITKYDHIIAMSRDEEIRKKLQIAMELYEKSFIALRDGGISIPWGKKIKAPPPVVKEVLGPLEDIWNEFKEKLIVIQNETRFNTVFKEAIDFIRQNNDKLLTVSDDVTEVFEEISSGKVFTLRKLLIIMLVFDILIFLIGYAMAVNIARPIMNLSEFARRVGEGDLTQQIVIPKTKDETRDLAIAFDKMTVDLQNKTVSRDYMDNILRSMTDTLVVLTPDAIIKTINRATLDLLGYQEEELIGESIGKMIEGSASEEAVFLKGLGLDLIEKGFINNVEITYLTKDGRKVPVLFSGSIMRDDNGTVQGIVCVAVDITDRKRVEENLLKLSQAMEQSPSSIIITDIQGKIEYVNPKFTKISGYTQEEALGQNPSMLKSGKTFSAEYKNLWKSITSGNEWRGVFHNKKKNGELYWEKASITALKNKDGKITHYLAVKEDITELKKAEEERQRMQLKMISSSKLASLGELSTGVAHEINQPLTYISSLIQTLKLDIKEHSVDETKLEKKLIFASGQVEKIISIINHLRVFGRQYDVKMEKIDIGTILENTLLLLSERIRSRNIKLLCNTDEKLTEIWGNANQMEQVFINLFQNAIDALQNKKENAEIRVDVSALEESEEMQIKFTDNGMGIEESIREKIFEPFFTTKEVGKGTGLGLSITYGIIQEHRGEITCESEVGTGTTFLITLPAVKTEDRKQRTEDREQKTGDRRQRTENRGQKTEDRRQGTEDRGQ